MSRRGFGLALASSFIDDRCLDASGYIQERASRFKITDRELIELEGHYEGESGVNRQPQVNPLEVLKLPEGPGFGIQMDQANIEKQTGLRLGSVG